MKLKMSKSQWERIGKKVGWMEKRAAVTRQFPAKLNLYGGNNAVQQGAAGQPFTLEVEIQIGQNTYQIPLGQNIPETQELYQVIGEFVKQPAQVAPVNDVITKNVPPAPTNPLTLP